jgi:hypothetical protein
MLHIASYHHYCLVEIHLSQGYFQHFISLTYEHEMSFLYLETNIFFLLHYDLHLLEVLNIK